MNCAGICRCGLVRAGLVAILAGLIGGCAEQGAPAPVFLHGDAGAAPGFTAAPAQAQPTMHVVVVRRGQTLDGYAYTYHVQRSAIIAANNLRPPYELKAGQRLTIPTGGGAVGPIASPPVASPPQSSPLPTQAALPPLAAIPQPPSRPETIAPPTAVKTMPEVIPLDGPPPREAAAAPPPAPPATLTAPKPAAPAGLTPPQPASPPAAVAGGRFPWPVRGRVLANYGNTPGGGHNDGINIAAPRGTPVHAIDAGTVAYSGNEVKGYGNILLIRHADGWISAYAHLDDVTVKPGDAISAGEVIAKVGDSGGIGQPQLHFELRRGKKPVDPREFLASAPGA